MCLFCFSRNEFPESCHSFGTPRDGHGGGGALCMYPADIIHIRVIIYPSCPFVWRCIMKPRLFETVSQPHPFGACYTCPKGLFEKPQVWM